MLVWLKSSIHWELQASELKDSGEVWGLCWMCWMHLILQKGRLTLLKDTSLMYWFNHLIFFNTVKGNLYNTWDSCSCLSVQTESKEHHLCQFDHLTICAVTVYSRWSVPIRRSDLDCGMLPVWFCCAQPLTELRTHQRLQSVSSISVLFSLTFCTFGSRFIKPWYTHSYAIFCSSTQMFSTSEATSLCQFPNLLQVIFSWKQDIQKISYYIR